jgi:hypothetical protein
VVHELGSLRRKARNGAALFRVISGHDAFIRALFTSLLRKLSFRGGISPFYLLLIHEACWLKLSENYLARAA